MKHIIWVNQWFSTMYQIIIQMKEGAQRDGISLHIIGTSTNKDMVYKAVCDEFYEEPKEIKEEDYAAWCLEFCKEHKVDVFIPKRRFLAIARSKESFLANGIKVLVEDDLDLLYILNNKVKTAELFKNLPQVCEVPPFEVVTCVEDFKLAYEKLKQRMSDTPLCIKYAEGEGGSSFKIIDEGVPSMDQIERESPHLTYREVVAILGSAENFKPLMIMPYLKGTEISIDAMYTSAGVIAAPRLKGKGRIRQVCCEQTLIEKAQAFADYTGLKCPFNLQLRYHHETLYLLEVNTRMSGGVHFAYYAGINLPYLALKQLLEMPINLPTYPTEVIDLSYIETPILL